MGVDHFLNLQAGTLVNERYEIVKCLGAGSMGMVYACRHKELAGHIVAMKVLYSEVAKDEISATRFKNEIFASYNVSHPNVVRAYEYFTDGDLTAFTMEYIGGGDLADRLDKSDPLDFTTILKMLKQTTSGLAAIHEAGIIHRDIKPENILITSQGDIKITDFGIARKVSGPRLTEHGGVVGTIDYVSPEYLELSQVDERSDIYSLGILAYEMITMEAPFKGKSIIETMQLRLKKDPTPPIELRKDCPNNLSEIVLKMMARDPEQRYQNASDLLNDLESLNSDGSGVESESLDVETVEVISEKEESQISREDKPTEVYSADQVRKEILNSEVVSGKVVVKEGDVNLGGGVNLEAEIKSEPGIEASVKPDVEENPIEILKSVLKKEDTGQQKDRESFSSFEEFASNARGSESGFIEEDVISDSEAKVNVARPAIDIAKLSSVEKQAARSFRPSFKGFLLWTFVFFVWIGLFFSVVQHYYPNFLKQ